MVRPSIMPGRVIVLCFALFMTGHGYARTVKSLEIEAVGQHDENLKNEAAERACKRMGASFGGVAGAMFCTAWIRFL